MSKKKKKVRSKTNVFLLYIIGALLLGTFIIYANYKGYMGSLDFITKQKEQTDNKNNNNQLSLHIKTFIDFQDNNSYGFAEIINKSENLYDVIVEIDLEDTGEKIYESAKLKPGEEIDNIKLDKKLNKGSYYAIAYFNAYDGNNYVGKSGAKIKINILN